MTDIKNLNIWKQEPLRKSCRQTFYDVDITELNLSVRSYNCLKRAGCHKIGDIIPYLNEEGGHGLLKIRNLGNRSEKEIIERIKDMEETYSKMQHVSDIPPTTPSKRLLRPGKKMWDMHISQTHLSERSRKSLELCGVKQIRDIYRTDLAEEPGWYAVRELFDRLISNRV